MSMMAEKLESAGVDTIGARLTAACVEAVRKNPESAEDAWRYVGSIFGHEFVRGLMKDMQNTLGKELQMQPIPSRDNHEMVSRKPYQPQAPRVIPPERLEKRRQLQQLVRSKYRNSGDVPWSDVGWHELYGLKRDGNEAEALLNAGPANVPNDGRTVGAVLGIKKTDEIIGAIRK